MRAFSHRVAFVLLAVGIYGSAFAAPKTIRVGKHRIKLAAASTEMKGIPRFSCRDVRLRPGILADGTRCSVISGTLLVAEHKSPTATTIELIISAFTLRPTPPAWARTKGIVTGIRAGVPKRFYLVGPAFLHHRPGARFSFLVTYSYISASKLKSRSKTQFD